MNIRLRITLTLALLILATAAVYWPALNYGFVDFDDPEYARDNQIVRAGLTNAGIQWAFTTNYIANWHPLTWLSLMLDAQIWGSNSTGYHLTNLLLHIANVLLVFGVLKRMTGAHWRSAMVAGLFALHPMHVESVAWVAERKDVLSTFFGLCAIWAYVTYVKWPGVREYVILAALYALSLLSKAMLVTLPCALLLLDYWPLKRGFWILDFGFWIDRREPPRDGSNPKSTIQNPKSILGLVVEKLPLLAIALAVSAITYIVQHGSRKLQEGDWIPLHLAAANALVSYARYVGKLFWPADLAALYPHPSLVNGATWPWWAIAGSVALLGAVTNAAAMLSRRRPYLIVGWLWFVGTMVPVIGFVHIGRQAMADRYAYVPFIGLYTMIAWGVGDLAARETWRKHALAAVMIAWLMVLAAVTSRQITYWRDSETLFEHALEVTEGNWLIHNNLAGILSNMASVDEREGRKDLAQKRHQEAISHLEEALRIYPEAAWVHRHFGSVLGLAGRLYESQQEFQRAIELDPNDHESYNNLGIVLHRRNQIDQAIAAYDKALALKPNYAEARRNRAVALASLDRWDEAVAEMEQARRDNPAAAREYDQILADFRAKYQRGEIGATRPAEP